MSKSGSRSIPILSWFPFKCGLPWERIEAVVVMLHFFKEVGEGWSRRTLPPHGRQRSPPHTVVSLPRPLADGPGILVAA